MSIRSLTRLLMSAFGRSRMSVDLRVSDLLNISRINNNRAVEMLLCVYHLLQPDSRNTDLTRYLVTPRY